MTLRPLHFTRLYARLLLRTKQRFSAWRSALWTLLWALLALAALFLLGRLLPWVYPLTITLLCPLGAMMYLYPHLRRRLQIDGDYRPEDALAEVIQIDADLIRRERAVLLAAQPFSLEDHISLRPASGLVMGMALYQASVYVPRQDAAALQTAVQELGILPETAQAHFPSLETLNEPELFARRVQDGTSERWYYAGSVERIIELCGNIWDSDVRPMEEEDRQRIRSSAAEMALQHCDAVAYATCAAGETPVFLGLTGIGDRIAEYTVAEIQELRRLGLTVTLNGPASAAEDLRRLRALLHLKDIHPKPDIALTAGDLPPSRLLKLRLDPGDSLVKPILWIRDAFHRLEKELRLCLVLLLPALALSLTTGWAGALSTALLCYLVTHLTIAENANLPKRAFCIALAVMSLLSLAMLSAVEGSALGFGLMGLMLSAASAFRLAALRQRTEPLPEQALRFAIAGMGIALLLTLVIGIISGISLLPTAFALMMGGAMVMLMLLGK